MTQEEKRIDQDLGRHILECVHDHEIDVIGIEETPIGIMIAIVTIVVRHQLDDATDRERVVDQ